MTVLPSYIRELIGRIEKSGKEAYVVGGAVRDMLLGGTPDDYDVTTSASPEEIMEIFSDTRTIPTGLCHGTVTVIYEGQSVEVTTYRVDGEYLDSRHPRSVSFTSDLSLDLSRRDFTVNAMAYSEGRGVIDLFGGRDDLRRGVIRAVGEPSLRFSEDALRIMRAFRFASKLDFEIEEKTLLAAKKQREGLSFVARERISAELIKLLCGKGAPGACEKMLECGIFPYALGGYTPPRELFECLGRSHVLPHIRLGILLSRADDAAAREALGSLRLSREMSADTGKIIEACGESSLAESDVEYRRFIAKYRDLTPHALDAAAALGAISPESAQNALSEYKKTPCVSISQLSIDGAELIALGLSGRQVGETLERLLERVIETPALNQKEILKELAWDILQSTSIKSEEREY